MSRGGSCGPGRAACSPKAIGVGRTQPDRLLARRHHPYGVTPDAAAVQLSKPGHRSRGLAFGLEGAARGAHRTVGVGDQPSPPVRGAPSGPRAQRRSGLRGRTVVRVERLSGFASSVDRNAQRVERLHRLAVPGTEDPHQQVDAADRSGALPARLAACVLDRELGLWRRQQPFRAAARRHQVAEPAMCRLAGDAQGSGQGAHRLAERQGASHALTLELDELLAQVPQRSQRLIRRGRGNRRSTISIRSGSIKAGCRTPQARRQGQQFSAQRDDVVATRASLSSGSRPRISHGSDWWRRRSGRRRCGSAALGRIRWPASPRGRR